MNDWISQGVSSLPGLLAVDLDTIVFLVVVGVSLLGRLFGRKEDPEHGEEWIEQGQSEQSESQTSQSYDWEEEMRRLLEGEKTETAPPPLQPAQQQAPPPLPSKPKPVVRNVGGTSIVTLSSTSSTPDSEFKTVGLDDLKAAKDAYARAKAEHGHAGDKLQSKSSAPRVDRGNRSSMDVVSVVAMLKSPAGARQAIVASTIISPPKGLE